MPLFSADTLGFYLILAIVTLIGVSIGLCVHEQHANRKAARTRAARVARQERADVAGRKANAEAGGWR